MTIEEINALTLDDAFFDVWARFNIDVSDVPEGEPVYVISPDETLDMYDRVEFSDHVEKKSINQFEDEFVIYKAELLAAEEQRLADEAAAQAEADRIAAEEAERARVQDLNDRFNAIDRRSFHEQYPDLANPALWLNYLISMEDHAQAEMLLAELEAVDAVNKAADAAEEAERVARKQRIADFRAAPTQAINLQEIKAILDDIIDRLGL